MKIRVFVTVVAPHAETGEAIEVKPNGVANIRDDKAQYLIDEGYAEKAKKKDAEEGVVSAAEARKGKVGRKQTGRGGATRPAARTTTEPTTRSSRRNKEALLGKGENPDREKGDNGKGFGDDDGADSNAE